MVQNQKIKIIIEIFLATVLFLISFTSCKCIINDCNNNNSVSNTKYSATESFSYEIDIKNKSRIDLEAINGSVDVLGKSDITSVLIWGERRVESESIADAKAHLNELEVQVNDYNDKVFVKTIQPGETHGRNYEVNYHIEIPLNWDVTILHVNGEVEINSLNADVAVNLVNGDVYLSDIFGNVDVDLTNGKIDGELAIPLQGSCLLDAVNGQIQLAIPKSTSAEFSAEVVNGTVSVFGLPLQNINSSPKKISGIIGDGQGTIELVAVNGTIAVNGF